MIYLILFVSVKAVYWGVNIPNLEIQWNAKSTFFVLSGMLSLSFFIHNIIISIMKNNRNQEHNVNYERFHSKQQNVRHFQFQGRDLSIAFGLVTFTYLFLGIVFYISFPLAKNCIEDVSNYTKSKANYFSVFFCRTSSTTSTKQM